MNNMGETQVKTAHPKGLWVLFGTEMWERFNFYGMRALLTLFLVNSLLMKEEEASLIYGGFLGLCYLTPMLGGFVADRFLGNRNCIILGGLLMAIGQLLLFTSGSVFEGNRAFATIIMYTALGVIVFGNGFFKPNISSMVGSLYPKQEKTKLDSAFTIFYMGINIGAFLGQSICPLLGDVKDAGGVRDIHAFRWGFLAASAAMFIGTILFYFLKNKYVVSPEGKPLGGLPSKNDASDFEEGEAQQANFSSKASAKTKATIASATTPAAGTAHRYRPAYRCLPAQYQRRNRCSAHALDSSTRPHARRVYQKEHTGRFHRRGESDNGPKRAGAQSQQKRDERWDQLFQ